MKLAIENHYPDECICKDLATNKIVIRIAHSNSNDIMSDMLFSLIMKFGKDLPKRIMFAEYEKISYHDHEVPKHMTKNAVNCSKNCYEKEMLRTPPLCFVEWNENGTYEVKEIKR